MYAAIRLSGGVVSSNRAGSERARRCIRSASIAQMITDLRAERGSG